jgi:mRNA interferase RelE/StbE
MPLELRLSKTALKAARALPPKDWEALRKKLAAYAADPRGDHPWARALTGVEGLRIRHGDYRAVCALEPGALVVVALGHRKEIYR